MTPDRKSHLGRKVEGGDPFDLLMKEDPVHVLVTGRTGYGKTRTLSKIIRDHVDNGWGIGILEPGDLCDDTLAYYAKKVVNTGNKDVLKRIHYLRAGPTKCFRYDLFRMNIFGTYHPELMESIRKCWFNCRVANVAEIFVSKQGTESFEQTPRLQRVLQDVLTCVATIVGGQRLSVGDAKILLDMTHPLHASIFEKLRPHLPREVVGDFEVLHNYRRMEDFRRETESTQNRMRSFLGILTSQLVSATGKEPAVDLYQIIQKGHCLMLPLQEDPFFSHDQKLSLGALILHDLIETMIITPREKRRRFTILIDEAGELLQVAGDRLMRSAGMLRKHLGTLIIAGQNLDTFRRE